MVFVALIHFAQAHPDFRLSELSSVAELFNFTIRKIDNEKWDSSRPFWVIELQEESHAILLAKRCILIKSIHELYGRGADYAEVHHQNRRRSDLWTCYVDKASFRFIVKGYNRTISQSRQKDIIESFSYMDLKGNINMKDPDVILSCFEEYDYEKRHLVNPVEIFFGRQVVIGTARDLILKFNVKKRAYYGNTSMDSEVSLLMANQALASKGKLIYDPFVGTGSMAYTVAHFGALFVGSDIDGRQIRGKTEKSNGIISSAIQYGVQKNIIDLFTFDITQNPWRTGCIFDAIVTDPPYGVRAGAKRIGRKGSDRRSSDLAKEQLKSLKPSVPPTKPYELSHLISDLVLVARYLLKPGGRLVFFLPTVTDEYKEIDVLSFICEGMTIVSNSLQDFGSWGRRLVTIKKTTSNVYPSPFNSDTMQSTMNGTVNEATHTPAHKDFREKYFRKFQKVDDDHSDINSKELDAG